MSTLNFILSPIKLLEIENKKLKKEIQKIYLDDDRVLSLGYSGGKDSSATLALTIEALMEIPLEKRTKKLYVLYSDTLMELLPVQIHTYKVLKKIENFAKQNSLPIEVMHAKPPTSETMWSMMIGRGIRPPSSDNRWCTTRLKTDVQENILYNTFKTKDIQTISIVGSRKEESSDRAKRLEKDTLDGHMKKHGVYTKSLVFAPIEDYTTEDVWNTLRLSKIGKDVLDAEDLYKLYASTNGEGSECQTILGNANDGGKNPGCSTSGGRFGCWNCALQYNKDTALVGMQQAYPYIKYLIRYRNWNVSIRDGKWERYRDVYNHRSFTKLQYNEDNHRFGFSAPGGMNLKTRAISLLRLLKTESSVKETEEDITLVSDEELEYIQHRWILEGDFNLTALYIAQKYNRDVHISEDDKKLTALAKIFHSTMPIWTSKISYWYGIYANERFAAQFVLQISEKYSFSKMEDILGKLIKNKDATLVSRYVSKLQISKQFYPSQSMEKLIRREWKNDKVSYLTESLIKDFEETWKDDEYTEDPFENPNISMEDKYAILDNWEYYANGDSNERFEHNEYMSFGGKYQYVNFRKRKSLENKAKAKVKKQARAEKIEKTNLAKESQLSFSF